MNLFQRLISALRLRVIAAEWRARNANPPITEPARRCIARHRNRVEGAIARNRLTNDNAKRVRERSDALIAAYLRGQIATIDDVTMWTLDTANRLGCAQQVERAGGKRQRSTSAGPAFLGV